MRRLTVITVACALAVSVLHADGRAFQQPAPAAAAQSADGYPAAGAPAAITLISTGAEPRTALRYKVPAGASAKTEVSTTMGMAIEMAGMALPEMKLPTMNVVTDVAVTGVAPNGDMTFTAGIASMKFDTAGVDPTIAAGLAGVNTDLSSVKSSGVMTNRGITNQAFDLTKVTDPQLKQMMDQAGAAIQSISFPLPEEAVGIGAKWEVRSRVQSNGLDLMSKQIVEVVGIQGSKVSLKITTEQSAPPQAMKNPALPPDAEVTLVKFNGTGVSTASLDLEKLTSEGVGDMTMAMVMQVKMQGMEQNMSMTTSLKIKTAAVK